MAKIKNTGDMQKSINMLNSLEDVITKSQYQDIYNMLVS